MIDAHLCSDCGISIPPNMAHACLGVLPLTATLGGATVTIETPSVTHAVDIVYVPSQLSGDRQARCSCLKRSIVTSLSLAEHWAREHLAPFGEHDRPAPATSR